MLSSWHGPCGQEFFSVSSELPMGPEPGWFCNNFFSELKLQCKPRYKIKDNKSHLLDFPFKNKKIRMCCDF